MLKRLDLSFLPKISIQSGKAITKYCKNLQALNVDFSDQIKVDADVQKARRLYGDNPSFIDMRVDSGHIFDNPSSATSALQSHSMWKTQQKKKQAHSSKGMKKKKKPRGLPQSK